MQFKASHPLHWPNNYPRTPQWDKGTNSSFKAGMAMSEAMMFLKEELQAINPQTATLLTDYENLETPRLMRKVGNDQGVVLKLRIDNKQYELACDRWQKLEHNIYALHLALRSLRSIVEWGVGSFAQAFGGYAVGGAAAMAAGAHAAGGDGGMQLEEWRLTLGLGPSATLEDASAVYRRRAKTVAGDQEELTKLNLAMDEASKALGS